MQKAYKDLDIQFLPDQIVQQFNQQKLTGFHGIPENHLTNSLSTELLSKDDLFQADTLFANFDFIHHFFRNF
jgi:predicted DNA-binding helix-hairpin-helix protein